MTRAEKKIRNLRIVELRKQGYSQNELCKMFGLKSIGYICKQYGVDGVMSNRKAVPVHIYGRGNQHSKRTDEEKRNYVESFLPSGFLPQTENLPIFFARFLLSFRAFGIP